MTATINMSDRPYSRAATIMYSREEPSPRYRKLIELYRQMHVEGEETLGMPPERTFAGGSLLPRAAEIKKLIDETGAQSLLDYGAGKRASICLA